MKLFLTNFMLTVVCLWCAAIAYNTIMQGNYFFGSTLALVCFVIFLIIIGGHDDNNKNNPKPQPGGFHSRRSSK